MKELTMNIITENLHPFLSWHPILNELTMNVITENLAVPHQLYPFLDI
jgi:hypothetical protein